MRVVPPLTLALLLAVGACAGSGGESAEADPTSTSTAAGGSSTAASSTVPAPGSTAAAATTVPAEPGAWLVAENARPGTTAWVVDGPLTPWITTPDDWIEGYASVTSAAAGDEVVLYVDTPAPTWRVAAYRMGWYGGDRGREVWRSDPQPGRRQDGPVVDEDTGLAEARWDASLRLEVGDDWPPGTYLLRLEASTGGAHLVPLTVRDDDSDAALLVVNAVTTWQAYNDWGACSLYRCLGLPRSRADVVSFDRPYFHPYQRGAADFLTHELAFVAFVEELGLDVTYVTDIDLHADPDRVLGHRAVVSLGHDEYYTTPMRQALEQAKASGVNLAFLGANAVYRHIRLEPGWDEREHRRMVNYRSTRDPAARDDPALATVEFREAPLNDPEGRLIGVQYECAPMAGDMVLVNTDAWVFEGADVSDGQVLERLVGNEYDRAYPGRSSPANLELLAHSPVRCNGRDSHHNMAYHDDPSGAGVFATGTIWWNCALDASCSVPENIPVVRTVTENVLRAFAAGPAGRVHPSRPNVEEYWGFAPTGGPATTAPVGTPSG